MIVTLSITELIWITTTMGASVFAVHGLVKWRREDQQRRRDGLNGPLQVFYRGKIRLYTLGLIAFILSFIRGIESALSPAPFVKPTPGFQTVVSSTFAATRPYFVITITGLFLLALIFDDRDRTLTDRAYEKKAEARLLAIEAAARHAAVRAEVAERRADVAFERADVAEQRADDASITVEGLSPRVDTTEGEIVVHTGEITDHTDRIDALENRDAG